MKIKVQFLPSEYILYRSNWFLKLYRSKEAGGKPYFSMVGKDD